MAYMALSFKRFRLCVTADGDLGIFRRSGWGKHGSEFAAVPRWHAGAVGDKALCSVNRPRDGPFMAFKGL